MRERDLMVLWAVAWLASCEGTTQERESDDGAPTTTDSDASSAAAGSFEEGGPADTTESTSQSEGPATTTTDDGSEPTEAPTVVWSELTRAGDPNGWNTQTRLVYDPISDQVLTYITDGSGIYSTTLFAVAVSGTTATFTRLGGTDGASGCGGYPDSVPGEWNNGDGSDVQPWPADRHPEGQTTIDTSRGHLYQWSGLACGNPTQGDGLFYNDMWRYALAEDPRDNTWSKRTIATKAGVSFSGAMVYVPTHDVIVLHGPGPGYTPETWVYCPTSAGSLSASQSAAGCSAPDDWARTHDTDTLTPPLPSNMNLVYDPVGDRVLMFTMFREGQGSWNTEVWAYDIAAKAWTDRAPADAPLNQQSTGTQSTVTAISSGRWTGKILYHRTTHQTTGSGQAADYLYDPVANTWTLLDSVGTGPELITNLTFVPTLADDGGIVAMEAVNVWWRADLQ